MAKRKAAKKQAAGYKPATEGVEPMVVALAEQLGSFLGRVQRKADGWLESEALRAQVSQIRDGAADLLTQVNRAAAAVRASAAKPPKQTTKKSGGRQPASPKRQGRESGEAPVKRLRKPPPQELFDPRLGEPMGKQMGQKNLKRRGRG